ncbi:MAG: hypothetical protein R2745_01850 [Vicinamibacterales bacterium]
MPRFHRGARLTACALALLGYATTPSAQPAKPDDPFQVLRPFVGEWDGAEQGQPGQGRGERVYEFVLGGRYLHARNVSRFPPQSANPKGEIHEDWKFFSYDRSARALALREFHVEGFVNYYLLDTAQSTPRRLVFESRQLENFDGRARYTITIEGPDAFSEIFEVGPDGRHLDVLVNNRWTRRRR